MPPDDPPRRGVAKDDGRGGLAFTRQAAAIYAHENGAREYVKVAPAWALCMDVSFTVLTVEGEMSGEPGDYLMVGGHSDAWPIKAAIFDATYRPVGAVVEPDGVALVRVLRNLLATVEHAAMINVDPAPFKRAVEQAHEALRAAVM